MNELELKIIEIIKKNIKNLNEINNLTLNDSLENIGINSVTFIKIIVELELEFGIGFEDTELEFTNITYINDVVNIVKEKQINK